MAEPNRYVSLEEAGRIVGLSGRTLQRRLAEGALTLFRDDRDRRRRLLAVEDLARLTRPTPLAPDRAARPPAA